METDSYDVFLSYNYREKVAVTRVAKELERHKIRVWFDEDTLRGADSIPRGLNAGLARSRVYAVCFGPAGFGNWQKEEIEVAIMRRVEKGHPLIPVLLPGVDKLDDPSVPLLSVLKPVAVQREPAFSKSIEELAALILATRPESSPPETRDIGTTVATKSKKSKDPLGEVIEELYGNVRRSGTLTFFLGAGSSERDPKYPPPPYEIARELLYDLEFIKPQYSELLPPLDAASSYYAVKKSMGELEDRVVDLVIRRSHCEPLLHQHLASVVRALARIRADVHRRRQARTPQLIVTTSIDLLTERALLRAGLSFTRIVQHRSGTKISINEYRSVEYVDGALRIRDREGHMDTVPSADSDHLDRVIATNGYREIQSVGGDVQPIRGLDLSDASDLVVYKYHGSHDVGESCALSTEHYLSLAVTPHVPDKIKEIIGNSPGLFLLCGMLDADVRHAYHTLLRSAYENGGERRQRVAVVRPPKDEEDDSYRRMEIPMWERAKDALRDRMGIKVVEGDSAQFLNRFLQRFEEGAQVQQ